MNKKEEMMVMKAIKCLEMRLDSLEDVVGQLHIETMENTDAIQKWLLIDAKFKESLTKKDGD